jgi:hypothetical protein
VGEAQVRLCCINDICEAVAVLITRHLLSTCQCCTQETLKAVAFLCTLQVLIGLLQLVRLLP